MTSYRPLPSGDVWVSLARNLDQLAGESHEQNCLNREQVYVSQEVWEKLIDEGKLSARLTVGGVETVGTPERVLAPGRDVLSFRFPGGETDGDPQRIVTSSTFFGVTSMTFFPVILWSYFCIGETIIRFLINDNRAEGLAAIVSFDGDTFRDNREGVWRTIEIRTRGKVVLWPGSSAVIIWQRWLP